MIGKMVWEDLERPDQPIKAVMLGLDPSIQVPAHQGLDARLLDCPVSCFARIRVTPGNDDERWKSEKNRHAPT
jgi:hypothetical protein